MERKTLIWFTGVISQFTIGEYEISKLKLNTNLLADLMKDSVLYFIIMVKDDKEREEYNDLLKKYNLSGCKVIYLPYVVENNLTLDYVSLYADLIQDIGGINMYIDYSKYRLNVVSRYLGSDALIHVSQLLS